MTMSNKNRCVDYDQVAPAYNGRYQRGGYAGIEHALLEFMGDDPERDIKHLEDKGQTLFLTADMRLYGTVAR